MPRPIPGMALVALLALASSGAFAQDYPTRRIHFLQGFPPGGNADAITRVLGEELGKALGQPVVVESRPGAGGSLASDQTAKAAPDGHMLVLLTTAHVISAALYKSLPFDPVNDFAFITTVSELPHFVVVNAKSPHQTFAELVAAAKAIRRHQLRDRGRRHRSASRDRAVEYLGRRQDGACALSRRRRGGHRAARG